MGYVGYSNVADQAPTTPGNALGVVANVSSNLGSGVGGIGVADTYSGVIPPAGSFILMQDSGYVLQEDGSRIYLEVQ